MLWSPILKSWDLMQAIKYLEAYNQVVWVSNATYGRLVLFFGVLFLVFKKCWNILVHIAEIPNVKMNKNKTYWNLRNSKGAQIQSMGLFICIPVAQKSQALQAMGNGNASSCFWSPRCLRSCSKLALHARKCFAYVSKCDSDVLKAWNQISFLPLLRFRYSFRC